MRFLKLFTSLAIVATILAPSTTRAQGLEEVKARYTKYEYKIPMRDGTRLFTAVYVPKDAASDNPYPIMYNRTPYSVKPYGIDEYKPELGPNALFGKEGYIFVYQDVRGRWMSEGTYVNVRPEKDGVSKFDESTDTYDSIEWLLANVKGHNGKVGMWGISYPGYYVSTGLIDAHPALKAASPQSPVTDWFLGDDWHHNGALFLTHCFNFMSAFGHPRPEPVKNIDAKFDHGTPDGYDFFLKMGPVANADAKYFKGDVAFWNDITYHQTYDSFWKSRNVRNQLVNIKPSVAVMTVGGWFDAENLYGALETYRQIEKSSPGINNTLVMGPWYHGGWSRSDGSSLGYAMFNSKTSEFYRESIELPFFNLHLKGKKAAPLPEAYVFETGTNQWRKYDSWPPKDTKPLSIYFEDNGALAFEPTKADGPDAFDEYVSDPAKPVPYIDGIDNRMPREYMVGDQRFASKRTDVLTYQTPELESDLTLAGPLKVSLQVSTTGTDSDFIVKLIDVYPNDTPDIEPNPTGFKRGGFQQLVRGDVMRGKFRESFETPKAFTPGEVTEVAFTIPDTYHAFRTGHRLMIQVQSSWFPLVDRNPQTFVDIYKATEADFKKATQRLYRSKSQPSKVEVLVLP